ncbi:MAG: pilus assembly protein PilM, partial [Candidatus Binatia bacterium]
MAFGASGVVAVELGSNQLRLIHGAVSGPKAKVYDFAAEEILVSNAESAAQQLSVLVAHKKLRSSSAALALSGPGVVHRVLDFPPMPLKELKIVVEREMRTATGAGGDDVLFEWEVIQGAESEDLKQVQVLVAISHRSEVAQAQELLRQCGLKPTLLTTAPISLLRSLKFVQGEGMGLQVILYIGGQQGYLLGVKNGAWSFYREFSSR